MSPNHHAQQVCARKGAKHDRGHKTKSGLRVLSIESWRSTAVNYGRANLEVLRNTGSLIIDVLSQLRHLAVQQLHTGLS